MNRRPPKNSGVPPQNRKSQRRAASATLNATPDGHSEPANGGKESQKLPTGWVWKTIGEIAKTSSGGTPSRGRSDFYGGSIPWVKSGELGDRVVYETSERITVIGLNSSSAKIFPKGTLCIALYGATVGKLGILGMDAATNQAVCGIFLPESMDVWYLFRYLESKRRDLIEMGKGGAQPNISQEIVRQTKIPIPPLPEQRRIVAEIEKQFTRLEAGVGALRRVQANLKRYRAAVLKAACEGKWLRKKIGDVASLVTKGSSPNWQGFNYCDDGIAFVRSQNVGWGLLNLLDVAHLPAAFNAKEKKSVLKAGDVLLNIVGASIGRSAVATGDIEGGNVNQAVAVIRLKPDEMLSRFLMFYLVSPATQDRIHSEKVDVARANFSLEDIRQLPVPVPPLAEQERIVAELERRLSVVEELSVLVTANLQRATRLRQAILQKAFSGQL